MQLIWSLFPFFKRSLLNIENGAGPAMARLSYC